MPAGKTLLGGVETEGHVCTFTLQARNFGIQRLAVTDGIDQRKVAFDGLKPRGVDRSSIHATGIEIADLLLVRIGRRISLGSRFEDGSQDTQVIVTKLGKCAP